MWSCSEAQNRGADCGRDSMHPHTKPTARKTMYVNEWHCSSSPIQALVSGVREPVRTRLGTGVSNKQSFQTRWLTHYSKHECRRQQSDTGGGTPPASSSCAELRTLLSRFAIVSRAQQCLDLTCFQSPPLHSFQGFGGKSRIPITARCLKQKHQDVLFVRNNSGTGLGSGLPDSDFATAEPRRAPQKRALFVSFHRFLI